MELFTAAYPLSFDDYLKTNNMTKPNLEIIISWRYNILEWARKDGEIDQLMDLFGIPEEYREIMVDRNYEVEDCGYHIIRDKNALYIYMELIPNISPVPDISNLSNTDESDDVIMENNNDAVSDTGTIVDADASELSENDMNNDEVSIEERQIDSIQSMDDTVISE